MLKVSLVELFFRGFPETLLFLWAINLINMKKLNVKNWILQSVVLSIIIYLVRLLPIQFGVNTLIAVVILILTEHYIDKLPLTKAISSSLIVVTLLSICEFINIAVLLYIFKANVQKMFEIPYVKITNSILSLILFIIFILLFSTFNKKINMGGTIK